MDDAKLMNWIDERVDHYSGLHEAALEKFDELQGDPDAPMVSLTEARLEVCRWGSRIVALSNLNTKITLGHFE